MVISITIAVHFMSIDATDVESTVSKPFRFYVDLHNMVGKSRHKASLQPHLQGTQPAGANCPNCGKQVNGVNPYDDGETWRR